MVAWILKEPGTFAKEIFMSAFVRKHLVVVFHDFFSDAFGDLELASPLTIWK